MALQLASPRIPERAGPPPVDGICPLGWLDRSDTFLAPGTIQHISEGCQIHADGDAADHLYRVVSGVVRTCKYLSDGRRQIEAFYTENDVFGFETGIVYTLSAEAVTDCTIVAFRRRAIESLAQKDSVVSSQLASAMLREFSRARAHALVLGRRGAVEKIATFLTDLATNMPSNGIIQLAMTRQDIADYLSLTIETVSRTLTLLERDGLIAIPNTRQIAIRDQAALDALVA
jgi:CRP/FNR family nitrogen fixation transcriptional regulator